MGHVWTDVRICNISKTKCMETRALVDTGATLSVLPRRVAEELSIKPIRRDKVETGMGLLEIERGVALIELKNRETVSEVWISDIIDKVLIGSVTLELLGLKLDPRTGKLEPAPLLLYFLLCLKNRNLNIKSSLNINII